MLPLATQYHTHYHLHPFYFMLFKFKDLVAKQHPTNTHTCMYIHIHTQFSWLSYMYWRGSGLYMDHSQQECQCAAVGSWRQSTPRNTTLWCDCEFPVSYLATKLPRIVCDLWPLVGQDFIQFRACINELASFPGPCPASRRLQYDKRRESGWGSGNKAIIEPVSTSPFTKRQV